MTRDVETLGLRIIAGKWRRRRLKNTTLLQKTRPTSDRLRETIFNILTSFFMKEKRDWETCHVLEPFAGTGALGLEALSRGAAHATFVEKDKTAYGILQENVEVFGAQKDCTLYQGDFFKIKTPPHNPYTLVFIDPPYHQNFCEKTLLFCAQEGWLGDRGVAVVEMSRLEKLEIPNGFYLEEYRQSGNSQVWILRF